MPDLSLDQLPEVFVSTSEMTKFVSREVIRGRLRKLASRLYTKNLTTPPEEVVKKHLWIIVGALFPDGLIADRTALENAPAADGSIFLISKKKRGVHLPGIKIIPRAGKGPIEGDKPFINGLHLSSMGRAYLENMVPSRARQGVSRTLSKKEMEDRLESLLRHGGEQALLKLRDEMKRLAPELGLEREFKQINGTIEALLEAKSACSRAEGEPYDAERLALFQLLYTALANTAPIIRLEKKNSTEALPFYEAYFSNFIEGTEFEVEEARDIVFEGKIPRDRPQDAHDVLGTYRLVSDRNEMCKTPKTFNDFLDLIRTRHATIMLQRPEKLPGQFKQSENRAGLTVFVSPELVLGTLKKGFHFYTLLNEPFHRAVFMMYLISEVHPFTDGNGRLGRVMMNGELVAAKETRLIIPTIYRNNYLVALKALSQSERATPLIRTLDFAQKYTHAIDWTTLESAQHLLEKTHAFDDSNDADLRGVRLTLPSPEDEL